MDNIPEKEEFNEETVAVETEEINQEPEIPGAEELIRLAESKAKEYKELAQRVQAEFDNYRKRNAESVRAARIEGGNEMILGILPIADSVDTALKMINDPATVEGLNLINKQFSALFSKYGVTEIKAEGEMFNPDFHNAVMQVEDGENSGKVVGVLQKGYMREGKVIRYSMVKVAK